MIGKSTMHLAKLFGPELCPNLLHMLLVLVYSHHSSSESSLADCSLKDVNSLDPVTGINILHRNVHYIVLYNSKPGISSGREVVKFGMSKKWPVR